ncbi:hypothetical protein KAR91_63075 [Candidatus Pacearchaeota archaeon]|nr:hypothetical protein [Candidatus Pacearchaeota archaeon]
MDKKRAEEIIQTLADLTLKFSEDVIKLMKENSNLCVKAGVPFQLAVADQARHLSIIISGVLETMTAKIDEEDLANNVREEVIAIIKGERSDDTNT